jgi:NADPH:quinone reductase
MATSGQMQAANLPAVGADFSVSRVRRAHHGDIMREAAQLGEAGKLKPRVNPRRFFRATTGDAYRAGDDRTAAGKIVVELAV